MILGGDEFGHSQKGNNNAYCQDNEISWLNWDLNPDQKALREFVRQVIQLRKNEPALHRRTFFQGRSIRGKDVKDISFFEPSGKEMPDEAWASDFVRCLGIRLAGDAIEEMDELGNRVVGDTLFLLLNAHHETIPFTLPPIPQSHDWEVVLDTSEVDLKPHLMRRGVLFELKGRSTAMLRVSKKSNQAGS